MNIKLTNEVCAAYARCSDLCGEELPGVEEDGAEGEGDGHLADQGHHEDRPVVGEHSLGNESEAEERESVDEE